MSIEKRPYIYKVVHKFTGEWYFGYNSGHKTLGVNYFTSSKIVNPRFNEFDIEFVRYFDNAREAYHMEQLHIYMDWDKPGLLNQRHFFLKLPCDVSGTVASNDSRLKHHRTKLIWSVQRRRITQEEVDGIESYHAPLTKYQQEHLKWSRELAIRAIKR